MKIKNFFKLLSTNTHYQVLEDLANGQTTPSKGEAAAEDLSTMIDFYLRQHGNKISREMSGFSLDTFIEYPDVLEGCMFKKPRIIKHIQHHIEESALSALKNAEKFIPLWYYR